jgi:hypothetical protein
MGLADETASNTDYSKFGTYEKLTPQEEAAWKLYCEETAGDMDVRDYWSQLPRHVREMYLAKVS